MTPPRDTEVIVYQYAFSPFARKVTNYMNLRNIPHSTVEQPPVMPRPDIASYGVQYRRIPVLSIGRDFYCDTPLMFTKLDELYPPSQEHPGISAIKGPERGLEYALQRWSGMCLFNPAVQTIPSDFGPMTDPKFLKDRKEIWGDDWEEGKQVNLRAGALNECDEVFAFLDSLVEDGRDFVLGDKCSTADIHALFLFDWLMESVPGSLPESLLKAHPKAVGWRDRYNKACKDAAAKNNPKDIEHSEASSRILKAGFAEPEGKVEADDPVVQDQKLEKGTKVDFFPTDNGAGGEKNKDSGELLSVNAREAVLKTTTEDGKTETRIHIPRWAFKIQRSG